MSRQLQILFLIVLSGCLYYYVIMAIYTGKNDNFGLIEKGQNIVALKALNTEYDSTLEEAKKISDKASSLKKRYSAITEEDKAKLKVILPESLDQVELINEVNNIFRDRSGFKVEGMSYTKGVSKLGNNVGMYTVTVSTKGTYEHFKNLVSNIENSMHFYTIKEVGFATPEKEEEPMSFNLKLETYFSK